MNFSVHPATIEDSAARASIVVAAFKQNPLFGLLLRDVAREDSLAWYQARFEQDFTQGADDGLLHFKAVDDESGQIVAIARWQCPVPSHKTLASRSIVEKPNGYKHAMHEGFFAALNKGLEKWVDGTKDFRLLGLSVHPDFQRRGLGSLLLKEGLKAPDRVGARTYLEASVEGVGLYEKFGWRGVEEILVDTRAFGGEGVASEVCMVREAWGGDGVGGQGDV